MKNDIDTSSLESLQKTAKAAAQETSKTNLSASDAKEISRINILLEIDLRSGFAYAHEGFMLTLDIIKPNVSDKVNELIEDYLDPISVELADLKALEKASQRAQRATKPPAFIRQIDHISDELGKAIELLEKSLSGDLDHLQELLINITILDLESIQNNVFNTELLAAIEELEGTLQTIENNPFFDTIKSTSLNPILDKMKETLENDIGKGR